MDGFTLGGPGRADAIGPAVAGSWYPADPDSLAREVDRLLDGAPVPPVAEAGDVIALIEPHAGYVYSGGVAAHGFRAVKERSFARVILLGPSHYGGFRGAALPDSGAYRTPLGEVPVDREALDALTGKPGFVVDNRPFGREHSLESEIPFLQRALAPGWRLLPVLIGAGTTGPVAQQVAGALAAIRDARTLVVVSSDFTHFGAGFGYLPFRDNVPERIRALDMGAVQLIQRGDVRGLENYLTDTGATVCGRDAIGILLRMLPAGTGSELAAYDTSGRLTGDWSHTVSYAALVFRARASGVGGKELP